MAEKVDFNCIFEIMPHECTWHANGGCTASSSYILKCVHNHTHNAIKPELTDYIVGLLKEELEHIRRTIGRKKYANS